MHDFESQVEKRIFEECYRITDGFGTSGQPESTLVNWKYTAKNVQFCESIRSTSDEGGKGSTSEEAPLMKTELRH